jgi:glutathione peroxidase
MMKTASFGRMAMNRRFLQAWAVAALALQLISSAWAAPQNPTSPCPTVWNHTLPRLQDEKPVSLCQFSGQVALVVNTASRCGFTPQYKGLTALHERYRDKGFVILGFPSGDFGGQELNQNSQIADFCEDQFAVKFPMFAKSSVRGAKANPVFTELIAQSQTSPKWNFYKYLVDRQGRTVQVFSSMTEPEDPQLVKALEKLLASR